MEISIAGDSTLAADDTLSINLEKSANNFHLKLANGSDTIAYAVSKDGQPLSAGDTVLTWDERRKPFPQPANADHGALQRTSKKRQQATTATRSRLRSCWKPQTCEQMPRLEQRDHQPMKDISNGTILEGSA